MQAPPSLHWAFPASYSTPMLHKFGGSTLSLALDISAEADQEQQRQQNGSMPSVVEESALSSRRESLKMEQRERALSATIAALTARQESPKTSPEMDSTSRFASTLNNGLASHSNAISRSARRTVPINIENLNSSNDSLTLPTCSVVDFPLPPSNSSGDVSSPDPDHVEQLCTPKGHQMYSKLPGYGSCYRRRTVGAAVAENEGGPIDSGDSGEESTSSTASARLRGQPSWSGDRDTVASGGITPLATPTSSTAAEDDEQHKRCGSYGSLVMDADNDVDLTPRAPAVMAKRHSTMHPTTAHVVL
jgi:hypothetical protein